MAPKRRREQEVDMPRKALNVTGRARVYNRDSKEDMEELDKMSFELAKKYNWGRIDESKGDPTWVWAVPGGRPSVFHVSSVPEVMELRKRVEELERELSDRHVNTSIKVKDL